MDEVTVRIQAPAERIYDALADVTQMGRWSPECTGGRWLRGADGPAVGARFVGFNRRGRVRWITNCKVTRAEPGRAFEFRVLEPGITWGYRFDPVEGSGDGGGPVATDVTEYRVPGRRTAVVSGLVARTGLIGRDRDALMVDGMRATLERVRAAVERPAA